MLLYTIIFTTYIASVFANSTGPASIVDNNVAGNGYVAQLNAGPGTVTGSIQITASTDGKGVDVDVSWSGFNLTNSKDYTYHIHQFPVSDNTTCNGTGAHFDQYAVGDDHTCDPSQSNFCQLGDLSGKHVAIKFDGSNASYSAHYHDDFLSTQPGNLAFFGNLSIVVHRKADKSRLNCGNFAQITSADPDGPAGATVLFANVTSTEVVATSTDSAGLTHLITSTAVQTVEASTTTEATSSRILSYNPSNQPTATGSGAGSMQKVESGLPGIVVGLVMMLGLLG